MVRAAGQRAGRINRNVVTLRNCGFGVVIEIRALTVSSDGTAPASGG
jgi:hypothetical protein